MSNDLSKDYGADPIGDGTFRMVPSGDIVDYAERMRRLPERPHDGQERIFGLTWAEIQARQQKRR